MLTRPPGRTFQHFLIAHLDPSQLLISVYENIGNIFTIHMLRWTGLAYKDWTFYEKMENTEAEMDAKFKSQTHLSSSVFLFRAILRTFSFEVLKIAKKAKKVIFFLKSWGYPLNIKIYAEKFQQNSPTKNIRRTFGRSVITEEKLNFFFTFHQYFLGARAF
jgi:hypothetical protein